MPTINVPIETITQLIEQLRTARRESLEACAQASSAHIQAQRSMERAKACLDYVDHSLGTLREYLKQSDERF